MTIRIIPCAITMMLLTACFKEEQKPIVTPVPEEMEAEWRAK